MYVKIQVDKERPKLAARRFMAILQCEFCAHTQEYDDCYDDALFFNICLPGLYCAACNLNTNYLTESNSDGELTLNELTRKNSTKPSNAKECFERCANQLIQEAQGLRTHVFLDKTRGIDLQDFVIESHVTKIKKLLEKINSYAAVAIKANEKRKKQ